MKRNENRLKMFRDRLPFVRKKVFSTMVIFIISLIITTTGTFAWVTLSQSPEVSSVSTTITSNGNLEIALCGDDAAPPQGSAAGDSFEKDGNVVRANTTWGNIINLYDESYGISDIILRPARLNPLALNSTPLLGAVYDDDGRVETDSYNQYSYFTYDRGSFIHSGKYGVRAIGTYTTGTASATNEEYDRLKTAFSKKHLEINNLYRNTMDSDAYGLPKLGDFLNDVAQDRANILSARLNSSARTSSPVAKSKVQNFADFYLYLIQTFEMHKEQIVALANFQQFVYIQNSNNPSLVFSELTWNDIYTNRNRYNTNDPTKLSTDKNISIPYLTQFVTDLTNITNDYAQLLTWLEDPSAKFYVYKQESKNNNGTWVQQKAALGDHEYDLDAMATRLLNYQNAKIVDIQGSAGETTIGAVTSSGSLAQKFSSLKRATLTFSNCILSRFELYALDSTRLDGLNNSKEILYLNVSARVSIFTQTISATCYMYTDANSKYDTSYIQATFDAAASKKLIGNDVMAQDTYGLAIDFWIRSNANSGILLANATVVDADTGDILRYDGINRVWNRTEDSALTTNSTTQGSGSCYVYYADTPEDMARSLDLLKSLKIAFVDEGGTLVGSAYMDTDHYWAQNGRVTVPFIISGEQHKLLNLVAGNAQRLTSLFYLDGTLLTNNNVLAVNSIQGLINLQFESDADLDAMDNEFLYFQEHSVSATASRTDMEFSLLPGTDLTTDLTVTIEGEDPTRVEAFFLRAINSMQGSREPTIHFRQEGDVWKATYKFTSPGNYWLRTIRLNGIDFPLAEPIKVRVKGYGIASVGWDEPDKESVQYVTSNSYSTKVSVGLSADDPTVLPKGLSVIFYNQSNNSSTFALKYNGKNDKWEGNATFTQSGTYTLKYTLDNNGKYEGVEEYNPDYAKKITIYMNMYAVVSDLSGTTTQEFDGSEISKNVSVLIYDGNGNALKPALVLGADEHGNTTYNPMPNSEIKLYYKIQGTEFRTDTNLTYDTTRGAYVGTLSLTKTGKYVFDRVVISIGEQHNTINKTTTSATYTITPPGGVQLDKLSQSEYNTKTQLSLNKKAMIGPIAIKWSDTATMEAIVKNTTTGKTLTVTYDPENNSVAPYITRATNSSNAQYTNWYIYVPDEIDGDDGQLDGKWTVEEISLWDCLDEAGQPTSDDGSIRVTWKNGVGGYNFSKLSTYVTTKIKVDFHQGTASVGNNTIPFYTPQTLVGNDSYATVQYQNEDGSYEYYTEKNPGITLNLAYQFKAGDTTYGYALKANPFSKSISIPLDTFSNGGWTWSEQEQRRYAGEYVGSLSFANTIPAENIDYDRAQTYSYKLYSNAPQADDIGFDCTNITQSQLNYSGDFLTKFSPAITATLAITLSDGTPYPTDYVAYPSGVTTPTGTAKLTYKGEVPAEYGLQGENIYATKGINFFLSGSGTTLNVSESKTLLPGTYSVEVTIRGQKKTAKDVTVILANQPKFELLVDTANKAENRYRGTGTGVYNNAQLETVTDSVSTDGKTATLHFNAAKSGNFINYTAPYFKVTSNNLGNGCSSKLAGDSPFVTSINVGSANNNGTANATPVWGEKTIDTITLTDTNGVSYVFNETLTAKAEQPPESTWVNFYIANDACSCSELGLSLGSGTSWTTTKVTYTNKSGTSTSHTLSSNTSSVATVQVKKGTNVSISLSVSGGKINGSTLYTFNTTSQSGSSASKGTSTSQTISNIQYNSLYRSTDESTGCIVAGTYVTLADGSKKAAENLTIDDYVLVFNHETGTYDTTKINFIEDNGFEYNEVVKLYFSDGTQTSLFSVHGYFDLDLMKYVYISDSNYNDFVGHRFYKGYLNGTTYTTSTVTLTRAMLVTEYTCAYGVATDYFLNFFVDDLLSIEGNIDGMFNFFDYDPDLKYNEEQMQADIAKYGLCTYEDFADYMSYETYLKYPAKYIKISIGKGLMTQEQLMYLIQRYAQKHEDKEESESSSGDGSGNSSDNSDDSSDKNN